MSQLLADPANVPDWRQDDERAEYEQSLLDEEAERDPWEDDEEPHPGFPFPLPLGETEAALMRADELTEALLAEPCEPSDYEPDPPTLDEMWPPAERAKLAKRLERIAPGVTLTELSDAREHAGLPRLSQSTSAARYVAPLWLLGRTGREALAAVRHERARLSWGMAPSKAARMRLSELRAMRGGE